MPAKKGEREHGPRPAGGNATRWLVTPKDARSWLRAPLDGVGETAFQAAASVGLQLGECFDIQPLPPDASRPAFEMPADPFAQLRGVSDGWEQCSECGENVFVAGRCAHYCDGAPAISSPVEEPEA